MNDALVEFLLVEDDANDEKLTLHALKKQNFANKIHVVRDGAEALEFVFCTGAYADRRETNPRVILLDLNLPLVHGLEVLRRIRADPRKSMIPVVILTASRSERDMVESYALGVNSYIVKPVDFEQFTETARQLGCYWLLVNNLPPGFICLSGAQLAAKDLSDNPLTAHSESSVENTQKGAIDDRNRR
jgi:two-component system, response regulator